MRPVPSVFVLIMAVSACNQAGSVAPDTLTGKWIEKTARQDTLIFNPSNQGLPLMGTLTVNRGKELNAGGFLVPKIGSGLYEYEIERNRISVINMYSSSLKRSNYVIERNGEELSIENFFELGFNQPPTATRTFVRLK